MSHRMLHRIIPSLVGLALCALATVPSSARAAESCADIKAWAVQNANHLPTTYEAFIQYPEAYRRAMLAVLPPQVQSALWRQHLEMYLAQHPKLTPEQVNVVRQAIELTSPKAFEKASQAGTRAALAALRTKGETVFDKVELSRILTHVGPTDSNSIIRYQPLCDCFDDLDCGGGTCSYQRCAFGTGCGPFGWDACDGVCR